MSVSPTVSDVDVIALELTVNPGDRGGGQTRAMATLISPTEAVTAHHVLPSLRPDSELTVRSRRSASVPAVLAATDPAADLALLRLASPLPFSGGGVADSTPEGGEWTAFLMTPSAPEGMAIAGVMRGREIIDEMVHLALLVSTGSGDRAGSSGAPVVMDGAVVGIVTRSNADGHLFALPVTREAVARLKQRERLSERAEQAVERFDLADFFSHLSPSSVMALRHAEGMRLGDRQSMLHMEHLIMGLFLKEQGPTRELFAACGIDGEHALREVLAGATDLRMSRSGTPPDLKELPPVSKRVHAAFEHAQKIARAAKSMQTRSRHLLEGALSVGDSAVIQALESRGVSRARLLMINEGAETATPIVGADSDAPSGVDRLGLETEIETLSALVASRSTRTPMSIGLFGNWGSGKSFFMQKMDERIRVFRKSAADDPDSPYCKSVIQLWFNAWHYIDRSLWASLGAEIFEGLAHGLTEFEKEKDGRSQLEDERTALFVKRADAEAARATAQEALLDSTADLTAQNDEIARLKSQTDREIERSVKTRAILSEVLAVASSQQEVKTKLNDAAKELGWNELSERSEVAGRQLREILALASYWQSVVTTVRDRSSARWWMAVAVFAGIAVLLAPWFVTAASSLKGSVSSIIFALVAFSAAATPVLAMAQKVTALVKEASNAMKKRIDSSRQAALVEAGSRRSKAEEKANADRQALEQRRKEVDAIDKQIEDLRPDRQIVEFIRRRNESTDYTKHFGVIARARQDFEELTRLMQAVRDTSDRDPKKAAPLLPVDRIVLYIDDLDRCPEDKVFEVLQAVHLLLAFPLFVVVVGVDPRWLFHSLRTNLRALGGESDDNGDGEQRRRWQSTPLNYLEKIFQIPFTLRPMRDTGYEQLIDDLTKSPESKESAHRPQQEQAKPATTISPDEPRQAVDTPTASPEPAQVAAVAANVVSPQAPPDPNQVKQTAEHAKQAHARMSLTTWETDHMKLLFPLIPTPRATKRFVNVYRLLRGLTTGTERTALIGNETNGGYRPVLVLLGMVTGYPVEAAEVMRETLERLQRKDCPENWWKLLEQIRTSREPAPSQPPPAKRSKTTAQPPVETTPQDLDLHNEDQWDEMFRELEDVRKLVGDSLTSRTMGKWAPVVARYSFASGRLLVADSKLAAGSRQVH